MKWSLVAGVAALFATFAPASRGDGPGPCPPGCVEGIVTMYRPEVRTRMVPCTVSKTVTRTVCEPYTYTDFVPHTVMQKQLKTCFQTIPRQVTCEVTCFVPYTTQ